MHWRAPALACALAVTSGAAQTPLDVRIALVVGNSAYSAAPVLPNASKDAAGMAATLAALGFRVEHVTDATRAQMQEAVARVHRALDGRKGVAMLYYAGHGVQVDYRNYMVPVDSRIAAAGDLPARAVEMGQVLEAFTSAGARMNILVLDACRDNPFPADGRRGLAPMKAPSGTFLAYATQPGAVAEDGAEDAPFGPYAEALIGELGRPFAKVEDVFKRVRFQVRRKTEGRQIPWDVTTLEDDFVFNEGAVVKTQPGEVERMIREARDRAQQQLREEIFRAEKQRWDRLRESRDAEALYAYLMAFPSGAISELAQARLEQVQPARIAPQADETGLVQPLAARRFRLGDHYEFVVRDLLTKLAIERAVFNVIRANDEEAETDQGFRATQSGAIIRTIGGATVDPYQQYLPAGEYQVGHKWYTRSIYTGRGMAPQWVEMFGKVVARETIEVPAGRFDVFRMELEQTAQDGSRLKVTYWGQPDYGIAVKQIREIRDPRGALSGQIYELAARSRRPS